VLDPNAVGASGTWSQVVVDPGPTTANRTVMEGHGQIVNLAPVINVMQVTPLAPCAGATFHDRTVPDGGGIVERRIRRNETIETRPCAQGGIGSAVVPCVLLRRLTGRVCVMAPQRK
jgi:hypothetical protein